MWEIGFLNKNVLRFNVQGGRKCNLSIHSFIWASSEYYFWNLRIKNPLFTWSLKILPSNFNDMPICFGAIIITVDQHIVNGPLKAEGFKHMAWKNVWNSLFLICQFLCVFLQLKFTSNALSSRHIIRYCIMYTPWN